MMNFNREQMIVLRMTMNKTALGFLALSAALGVPVGSVWASASGGTTPATPRRPNILFILTDDQRWDTMGCAGNPIIQTPNMDRLAREGVRFQNMFVTTAICAASRASILTGLYERTHRFTFGTPPVSREHSSMSYPVLLKQAGYRTGFVGKFGVAMDQKVFGQMFDYYKPSYLPYWKKQPDGTLKHLTDIQGEAAMAFLDTLKPGEPFCLSVSFGAPHAEGSTKEQYFWQHECDSLYETATVPVPKTMDDAFFNAHPEFLRTSLSRVFFNKRFNEPAKFQHMVKGYYKVISGVDLLIGRICEDLAKHGLAENTVIIFSGDNGMFLGERGFAEKWYIYEPSIRVPLIIYDPRVKEADRGRVPTSVALNVDIAPTILDFAGVVIPKRMQGRSLCPLLTGQTPANWRTDFFYEHLFDHKTIPKSEGVRTARFTYVRWFEQQPVVEELYDHEADFDQAHNLAGDPKFAEVLAQLRQRTDQLRDQYGGPYVGATPQPAGNKPSDAKE